MLSAMFAFSMGVVGEQACIEARDVLSDVSLDCPLLPSEVAVGDVQGLRANAVMLIAQPRDQAHAVLIVAVHGGAEAPQVRILQGWFGVVPRAVEVLPRGRFTVAREGPGGLRGPEAIQTQKDVLIGRFSDGRRRMLLADGTWAVIIETHKRKATEL